MQVLRHTSSKVKETPTGTILHILLSLTVQIGTSKLAPAILSGTFGRDSYLYACQSHNQPPCLLLVRHILLSPSLISQTYLSTMAEVTEPR